ncbi:VOC family protein [Shimia biformata]|uniref:VOC family protein n=1 Tax=Shimia biformata TaxID=1294299 RepID=UPI0019512461|nr:VOC family protein [Shimia biformata]
MAFIPYLNFDGNCAEAMQFYADLFGATEVQILRFSDAPSTEGMPPSDRVMYSHIMLGEFCLMGSDYPPGMEARPQESVSVNHPVANVEGGQALFDRLAEGGQVTMPFAATFFSPGFGMVRDRFGTNWMIGVPGE